MNIFKCKMCGGNIEFEQGATIGVCDSCGTKQTLPKLDDERKAQMYDRANHFRRNNEFDKAIGIYESILNEDNSDAEAYWSLVLCRYGIEYVEDPVSHKRVPTVNRAQYTSIFADEDYKSALANADVYQKSIYEEEAKAIDEIQKGILEISQKEEPFDVFICYKETDANGRRTVDSVRATELYHELTKEGFKVFFARITLEDKLGSAYEPYIFAALNSAKVMVVLGTKPEHFNAVWVKNEWSRYLALIKSGAKKALIPAYENMDAYDLPEEFSHLQAQDMTKLGFMQDLIRGIKKITAVDEPKATIKETVVINNAAANTNVASLLGRGFMALEDGEWEKADGFFEEVLNHDFQNAQAYLGKLMSDLQIKNKDSLKDCAQPFDNNNNCIKAGRFDPSLSEKFKADNEFIRNKNEEARLDTIYMRGINDMTSNDIDRVKTAISWFESVIDYKDSKEKIEECNDMILGLTYEKAESYMSKHLYGYAKELYESIIDYKDSKEKIEECNEIETYSVYEKAKSSMANYNYDEAIKIFESIPDYKDSKELIETCNKEIELSKVYNEGISLLGSYNYTHDRKTILDAIEKFESIPDWRDSKALVARAKERLQKIDGPAMEYFKKEKIGLIFDIIINVVPAITFIYILIVSIFNNLDFALLVIVPTVIFIKLTFNSIMRFKRIDLSNYDKLFTTYNWQKEIKRSRRIRYFYYLYVFFLLIYSLGFIVEGFLVYLLVLVFLIILCVVRIGYIIKNERKMLSLMQNL